MCLWYQCFFLAQVVHLRAMTQSDCVLIFLVLKPLRAQMHSEDGPPLPVVQRLCGPLQPSLLLPVHVVHLVGVCLCLCRRLHAVHPAQGTAECESPFPPRQEKTECEDNSRREDEAHRELAALLRELMSSSHMKEAREIVSDVRVVDTSKIAAAELGKHCR